MAALWRKRFLSLGIKGLLKEAPRPGRTPSIPASTVEQVIRKTTQTTPPHVTHWSTRTMAREVGISEASVRRIWRAHGLKPHRLESFKISRDPEFAAKLEDIVGLYLNPPEHALVLSVDEKSQIQALDRTQPGLPMKKGRGQTMTHDYKRNGTTTLFAALNTATGEVYGLCQERHRHQEWLKFLRLIDETVDAEKQFTSSATTMRPTNTRACSVGFRNTGVSMCTSRRPSADNPGKTGPIAEALSEVSDVISDASNPEVNGRIGRVKTEASQDEVPLDPAFADILRKWKGDRDDEGLVFPSPITGRPYYAGVIQQHILKPKGEEIGVAGLGWHTFRHTYRGLLDETGAPIGVQQKLMRHSNVATTMNVYGNATIRAKQQANSKVVQLVMKERQPQAERKRVAV